MHVGGVVGTQTATAIAPSAADAAWGGGVTWGTGTADPLTARLWRDFRCEIPTGRNPDPSARQLV